MDKKCKIIIWDDSLQQYGYAEYNCFCPLAKTTGMMSVIAGSLDMAQETTAVRTGGR